MPRSNRNARGYTRGEKVKDSFQFRKNAYRVLLAQGRDASVVFVPELAELDATYSYLKTSGFKSL